MLWASFNGHRVGLVQSLADLSVIRENLNPKVIVGVDTETTGLSYISDRVVGVCISCGKTYSPKDYCGFYLPIRHIGYVANLPIRDVIAFVQWVVDNFITAWFNRNFDFSMLETDGFVAPFVGKTHDVQVMAYEVYSEKMPSLKAYAKRFLKFQTISFEDNAAAMNNFGMTDPHSSFVYAAGDPLLTALLGLKLWNDYPHIHTIYSLDNESSEAVRRLSKEPITIDFDYLRQEEQRVVQDMSAVQQEIFRMVGYPFNVASNREVAEALSRFVTLTTKTRSGAFAVSKDVLAVIDHPIAQLLLKYSKLDTHLKSFVRKLLACEGTVTRLNYNCCVTATGRLSSSASKGNDFYMPCNGQNFPKLEVKGYLHTHPYLGYCLKETPEGCVCGEDGKPVTYKTKAGLRNIFIAPPVAADESNNPWVYIGADFASQEILVSANMSQEDGFLTPLKQGADIHLYVAANMFGKPDPAFRSKSKAVSFGKLYGGGKSMIAGRLGISESEAQALIEHYDKSMPKLKAWQTWLQKNAKRTGFARTYFGRNIYLADKFASPDRGKLAEGLRDSLNYPIQGSLLGGCYLGGYADSVFLPWGKHAGHRILFDAPGDSRYGVPTFRGKEPVYVVLFSTGDFCVCNAGHKFVAYKAPEVALSLEQTGDRPVGLVPPRKKSWGSCFRGLFRRSISIKAVYAHALAGRPIKAYDPAVCWCLFKCWFLRRRVHLKRFSGAMILRSVCDLFGWNLVYDFGASTASDYVFRVHRSRRRKAMGVFVSSTGESLDVMSPAMCSGLQSYPLAGMYHKNTGGDIIRRCLVKFERLNDLVPWWRDNVKFQFTIHDEVQLVVRLRYLHKVVPIVQKVMNFWPDNFQVPVVVEPCVGTALGMELDIDGVLDDGRIIPKGFKPPKEYLEGHEVYWVDSWMQDAKKKKGVNW